MTVLESPTYFCWVFSIFILRLVGLNGSGFHGCHDNHGPVQKSWPTVNTGHLLDLVITAGQEGSHLDVEEIKITPI